MNSLPLKQRIAAVQNATLKLVTMSSDALVFWFKRPGEWVRFDTLYPLLYVQAGKPAVRYDVEDFAKAPAVTFHRCLERWVVETDIRAEQVQLKFDNGDILVFALVAIGYDRVQITRGNEADDPPLGIED